MSDNVVPLRPANEPEEIAIWICGCGCQSFRLQSDGTIECCVCHNQCDAHSEWRRLLPDVPAEIERDTSGTLIVSAVGSPELAKRRVLKQIEEWSRADQLSVLAAYTQSGEGKQWLNFETEDDREAIIAKLLDLVENVRATAV